MFLLIIRVFLFDEFLFDNMSVYGGAWIQGLCYVVKSANSRGKSFSSLLLPLILHQVLGYLHHRHHTCITVTSCVNRGADMRVPFDEYSMKEWLLCKHNPFPFNEIFSNVKLSVPFNEFLLR